MRSRSGQSHRPLSCIGRYNSQSDRRYAGDVTTKEKLRAQLEELSEQEAEYAQIIVRRPEPDVVGLPEGWGETLTGEPMPNVVAAVRRVRGEH